jgi:hypothetical protein
VRNNKFRNSTDRITAKKISRKPVEDTERGLKQVNDKTLIAKFFLGSVVVKEEVLCADII